MDANQEFLTLAYSFGSAALVGAFNGPFKSLEDLFYTHFGYKTDMKRAEREAQVQAYKESVLKELSKIPPEKYQTPKLSVVGPAIEASRYYIQEEDIREMFAKLLASSCDSSKNDHVHESFVEIIKQLSVNDAKLLALLPSYGPLVDYNLNLKTEPGLSTPLATEVYLSKYILDYKEKDSFSINNLQRLSIITFDKLTTGDGIIDYGMYEKIPLYKSCLEIVKLHPEKYTNLELKKYYYNITLFGKAFKSICL